MTDAEMRAALLSMMEMAKVQAETIETLGKVADQHREDAEVLSARISRIERHLGLKPRPPACESPVSIVGDVLRGTGAEKASNNPAKKP
jgi:hypothetical protein